MTEDVNKDKEEVEDMDESVAKQLEDVPEDAIPEIPQDKYGEVDDTPDPNIEDLVK